MSHVGSTFSEATDVIASSRPVALRLSFERAALSEEPTEAIGDFLLSFPK